MLRYLKAAFFARLPVSGLGALPLNALIVGALAILGFGHPAFWLLGIGLETAYLGAVATNKRFQNAIDAQANVVIDTDTQTKRRQLIAQLVPPTQQKMLELEGKCGKAVTVAQEQGVEDYILESNRNALDKLGWLYLKLLLARQNLMSQESQANGSQLLKQLSQLKKETSDPKLGQSLRESKTATLQILQKRVDNLQRREQSLAEIDSDLTRIEAQVELAVENAGMSGAPQAVSSNISLVSELLEPDLFGREQSMVADLDQTFGNDTSGGKGEITA
jgi:hypothetical protein